jgi:hypothetical protein
MASLCGSEKGSKKSIAEFVSSKNERMDVQFVNLQLDEKNEKNCWMNV